MLFSGSLMAKKRKTRQEKIIAELRRKLAAKEKTRDKSEVVTTTPTPTTQPVTQSPIPSLIPASLIKKDLTKTFVLAILAISLELVLYFFIG